MPVARQQCAYFFRSVALSLCLVCARVYHRGFGVVLIPVEVVMMNYHCSVIHSFVVVVGSEVGYWGVCADILHAELQELWLTHVCAGEPQVEEQHFIAMALPW